AASVALTMGLPESAFATFGASEAPYAVLAQTACDAADPATRDFLLRTCVYDTLRFEVLDRPDKDLLAGLIERDGLYINAVDADAYRYDSSFRNFLRATLQQHSVEFESQVLVNAGGASERANRWADALKFHRQAKASAALARVLADRGFALIEVGAVEAVEAGIEALPESLQDRDPKILALRAIIDSQHARFDTSEAWFRLAIHELADEDLRLRILYRYALDLLRRSRLDCIDILEPSIEPASQMNHELYPMLCATLATAYALADRFEESRTLIAKAVPLLEGALPSELRARGYHQAAYVALRCGEVNEAERYALKARYIAIGANLYDLAARASSILYEIAYVWNASPSQALEYVENVASFALKSGDAAVREWALVAAYYVAAERGDAAMMATIERSLDVADVLQMTNDRTTTLLPGQALRAAWSADFAHAYQLLARSGDEQLTPDRRALRWAEIALYAAAAGLKEPAVDALREAQRRLPDTGEGKLAIQALSFALLAATLLREMEVRRDLRSDGRLARLRGRLAALFEAVETVHDYNEGTVDHHALLAALDALRDAGLGGIAAMFEALPAIPRLEEPAGRL
ncbi:MAG: hypothetical protein ACRENA_03695, partial [Vulcanimicrobiaceae bacterium]